jgi:plasmid stabilization system protein ParE
MVGQSRNVIASPCYERRLTEILAYGIDTFGYRQARKYFDTISHLVERLDCDYTMYPECRYFATKSRIYRNIILDAHLIIYRITDERIEVEDIIHSASSIRKIRGVRNIRL